MDALDRGPNEPTFRYRVTLARIVLQCIIIPIRFGDP